jgi:hypothetical protein
MRDSRVGAPDSVTVYSLIAVRARAASARTLAAVAVCAGAVALGAVVLGLAHWTLLTACYLLWSIAVWGLVFGPEHPHSRPWRTVEYLLVASDTALAGVLGIGLFFLALGPRWML